MGEGALENLFTSLWDIFTVPMELGIVTVSIRDILIALILLHFGIMIFQGIIQRKEH